MADAWDLKSKPGFSCFCAVAKSTGRVVSDCACPRPQSSPQPRHSQRLRCCQPRLPLPQTPPGITAKVIMRQLQPRPDVSLKASYCQGRVRKVASLPISGEAEIRRSPFQQGSREIAPPQIGLKRTFRMRSNENNLVDRTNFSRCVSSNSPSVLDRQYLYTSMHTTPEASCDFVG